MEQHQKQPPRKRPQHMAEPQRPARPNGARPQQQRQRQVRPNGTRPQQRPAQQQRPPQRTAAHTGQRRPARTAAKRDTGVSWLTMLLIALAAIAYTVLLSFVLRGVSNKANAYLSEYEESRPQYKMEEYVSHLSDAFLEDMLKQSAESLAVSDYETADSLMASMTANAQEKAVYSYCKTEDFAASHPTYYILRNGEAVASIALVRSGWTAGYSFPVWRMSEPVSLLEVQAEPAYTLTVTMPEGAQLRVNGIRVPQENMTETKGEIQLSKAEQKYAEQPVSQSCEISGLYAVPEVEVKDADGNVLTPDRTPDPAERRQEYVFLHADEKAVDAALHDRVTGLTEAYLDYVFNKKRDRYGNLTVLNNYLLPGSEVSQLMRDIFDNVHQNTPYSEREDKQLELTHVKMYSDTLCVCDVSFETRLLTDDAGSNCSGTVRWVMIYNGYYWYATAMELLE